MGTLKIFFHDNCFDGTASAAVFADFYRKHRDAGVRVVYQGVQHMLGDPFEGLAIDGDDNACVDFRYCDSDHMTWWFDHHVSAFQPPDKRVHFDADRSGQKFYDPAATSCTRFQVKVLEERFGYQLPDHMHTLMDWADVIDSARFGNPRVAVDLNEPATELMTWVRHNKDAEAMGRYIEALQRRSMAEIATEPWIRGPLEPLLVEHQRNIELIRRRAVYDGGVVFVDLTHDSVDCYNSFISYFLFPEARYTVGVVCDEDRVRITVGYNPWSEGTRSHNIAAICERFGGGGHPFVGGVTLPASKLEQGRHIADIIRAELMSA